MFTTCRHLCRAKLPLQLVRAQAQRALLYAVPNLNKAQRVTRSSQLLKLPLVKHQLAKAFSAGRTAKSHEDSKHIVTIALFGNALITSAKVLCYMSSGSSAMLSEAIHSLVDSGNQALLLIGLRNADHAPDGEHPYGYGRSIYFWSLVSALGTFWFGAGISLYHSVLHIVHPTVDFSTASTEVWAVLGFSFLVDGWVLTKTLSHLKASKPESTNLWNHIKKIRDPTTLAVLMEDSAACTGILVATAGIGATQLLGNPMWDGIAGAAIASLMGGMGLYLVRLNQRYLLGQAVDSDIMTGIKQVLKSRNSIDDVHSEQSQWIGPTAFIYKAEVDFDGTWLAAKLLRRYQKEFTSGKALTADEVKLLLAWYAEDVMRAVEQEVHEIEIEIRNKYPEAAFIELEPDSSSSRGKGFRYAIDEGNEEGSSKKLEMDDLNKFSALNSRDDYGTGSLTKDK